MTPLPPLAFLALKRKPWARDTRAPRAPSIVGRFCRLPWRLLDAGHLATGLLQVSVKEAVDLGHIGLPINKVGSAVLGLRKHPEFFWFLGSLIQQDRVSGVHYGILPAVDEQERSG